jgi:predicted site-specific integrase-resolvase
MGLMMRRGEAMRELGVGWRTFQQLVESGKILPRKMHENGRCWFWRPEVEMAAGKPGKQKEGRGGQD